MLFSATSMSICFAFIAGLVSQANNTAALKASVLFLYLYYVVYTTGFLGLPFMYAAEIAPAKQRAAVCGISTAVSWIFNFLVAEVTPVAFTDVGWKYFIVYCVLNAAWVPIIYFFFPETKGECSQEVLTDVYVLTCEQVEVWKKSMRSLRSRTRSLIQSRWRRIYLIEHWPSL